MVAIYTLAMLQTTTALPLTVGNGATVEPRQYGPCTHAMLTSRSLNYSQVHVCMHNTWWP